MGLVVRGFSIVMGNEGVLVDQDVDTQAEHVPRPAESIECLPLDLTCAT